ncbi:hypothetical protein Lupro_05535 [Lutibacter profundi]|uniref:Lipoprotein n=1 Tax=Lutibacter profundi TaxID=1622118 RepID=A0A120IE74_9FLAO|nr:hypothetical protein [Lutibacter profundi]AMC10735.1 hypothetical protein Lupro_05535 [Lutibacter profundi]
MKKIILLLVTLALLGCAKKEVQLPTLAEKGLHELFNHSEVWIFFEVKNHDTIADVNRKNTISTTHWIFNIDKRLPLKAIIPSIRKLQYKHANSIHSEEGMHNYFSYADTLSKKLSFLKFDGIIFKTDSLLSKYFIKENPTKYVNYNNINLTFNPNNTWINDAKMERDELKTTLLEFIDFSSEGKKTMLHLNFNENLLYQDYLFYKTMIHNFKNKYIEINKIEFIFNPTKVPDCGCE